MRHCSPHLEGKELKQACGLPVCIKLEQYYALCIELVLWHSQCNFDVESSLVSSSKKKKEEEKTNPNFVRFWVGGVVDVGDIIQSPKNMKIYK